MGLSSPNHFCPQPERSSERLVKPDNLTRTKPKKPEHPNKMKTLNHKALLAGAAIAGLMTGSAASLHAAQAQNSNTQLTQAGARLGDSSSDKHACKGQNACKGKGGCKTGDNGCKAQNSCKGKGGCATDGSKA